MAEEEGSDRSGEEAVEEMTDRDGVKDREKDGDGEMETMRGETKQVASVIAWGI